MGGGVIALLSISYMAFMPHKAFSQNRIACDAPIQCNGWLYHVNKIGIGTGWGELYTPRTTLHLHEFNSTNTYLNITNQTTGFPSGNQTLGMFVGMTGNKATISNFQNDNLVLATGTTERLIITPTGNIGVGISTPQNLVHIHKNISTILTLKEEESKSLLATSVYGIQITNLHTGTLSSSGLLIGLLGNGDARIVQQRNYNLSLGVNNTDVITINTSKNVGIGTTTPTAKLHTKGTLRFENLATATTFQNQKVLIVDANGNVNQVQADLIGDNLGNHSALQNIKMNDQWLSNDGEDKGIKVTNNGDVLIYGTLPSGQQKTFEQNNGFEIVTRGRIPERRGISLDDDPLGNLNFWIHVWQNNAAFNFMRNDHGSTKKLMVINKNGQVGINVDNPEYTLDINGNMRIRNLAQDSSITEKWLLTSDTMGIVKLLPAASLKDNMGNHIATQNIRLNHYWLSPDGSDNKGLQLKDNGNIQIGSSITQVNIGNSYSNAPYYLSSYIGFNAQRNNQGQWLFASDGANNGGSAFISDVAGNLRIVTYRPTQGTTTATLSEAELIANTKILITSNGNIGIGTTQLDQNSKLTVKGKIKATEIELVDIADVPDYVFEKEYLLMTLKELEDYIKINKHLPEVPSAVYVKRNGLPLGEFNVLLLKKIEELTLYLIQIEKDNIALKERITKLENNK